MIKNILIDLNITGNGIVNFDSGDQKWIYNNEESKTGRKTSHNNVTYCKKNFYRDEMEQLTWKVKISRDCIVYDLFKEDIIAQTPNISHHDSILYSYIASPVNLIRGYMIPNTVSFKRKGALMLTDAEQICNAVSYIETFAKSGEKVTNENKDDKNSKSDNSFYKKETIGNIEYKSIGNIDLQQLQFISCDQTLDRYSFNPDNIDIFKNFLSLRMDDVEHFNLQYYKLKNSILDIAEYGILLNDKNVKFLVKQTLLKLLKLNIQRKGAFAKTKTLRIKLVNNPLIDTFDNENNWINIENEQDIDNLIYDIYSYYEIVDFNQETIKRNEIQQAIKNSSKPKK